MRWPNHRRPFCRSRLQGYSRHSPARLSDRGGRRGRQSRPPQGRKFRGRGGGADRTERRGEAVRIGNEVETLYANGPAGGGGAFKSARDVVAVASVLLPRELAKPRVQFVGA